MNVLDLFSGIGGFSLGLERAGMRTVAFCEIEPFQRAVLTERWPEVPIYDDVRTLTADRLRSDGISVDVICGGFPCQDISAAGKGAGLDGERSGLWTQYARIIGEVRPAFVIVENVAALLARGLDRVLGDLAALGYDAEWHCIPASAVGAPHRRDRIWIVAYPNSAERRSIGSARHGLAQSANGLPQRQEGSGRFGASGQALADANGIAARGLPQRAQAPHAWPNVGGEDVADTNGQRRGQMVSPILGRTEIQRAANQAADCCDTGGWRWWEFEPDVGRVAHGVSARVDRLKGLGNAVVPQIPEIIGRVIMTRYAMTSQPWGSENG
jgi:DNA (cytosine-5)-methyltransferase 1